MYGHSAYEYSQMTSCGGLETLIVNPDEIVDVPAVNINTILHTFTPASSDSSQPFSFQYMIFPKTPNMSRI